MPSRTTKPKSTFSDDDAQPRRKRLKSVDLRANREVEEDREEESAGRVQSWIVETSKANAPQASKPPSNHATSSSTASKTTPSDVAHDAEDDDDEAEALEKTPKATFQPLPKFPVLRGPKANLRPAWTYPKENIRQKPLKEEYDWSSWHGEDAHPSSSQSSFYHPKR